MKRFIILSFIWLIGLILIPINKYKNIQSIEDGEYYSDDIIIDNKLYKAKNSNIIFKDGIYTVTYDIYAKCTNYYPDTGNCADNDERFIEEYQGSGTYEIKGTTLNLYTGIVTRVCKINEYNFSIDCTSTGGWKYLIK